jgi:hypothetical protein
MEWLLDYHGKIQKRLRETVAPWHLVGNGNPHEAPSLLAHRIIVICLALNQESGGRNPLGLLKRRMYMQVKWDVSLLEDSDNAVRKWAKRYGILTTVSKTRRDL